MKSRLAIAAICVPILFVVLFFLPSIVLAVITAAICAISAHELVNATLGAARPRVLIVSAAAAALVPFGVYFFDDGTVLLLLLLVVLTELFAEAFFAFDGETPIIFTEIVLILFASVVMPYLLSSLVGIKQMEGGRYYILLPFAIAFLSDAGAYFVGTFYGRHKIAPGISPNKSLEGTVGGFVTAIAAMLLYGLILRLAGFTVSFPVLAAYGYLGSLFTQVGDLAFSMVKREYQIKDYGSILAGHGGMLDRFDSMVFTAPLVAALLKWFPPFIA